MTGGTGVYRSAGEEGTLVEFGNGKGRMTLHLLSLVARGTGTLTKQETWRLGFGSVWCHTCWDALERRAGVSIRRKASSA